MTVCELRFACYPSPIVTTAFLVFIDNNYLSWVLNVYKLQININLLTNGNKRVKTNLRPTICYA